LLDELSENPDDARFCFLAKRSKEIFNIFKTVYGTNNRDKLKFIISS